MRCYEGTGNGNSEQHREKQNDDGADNRPGEHAVQEADDSHRPIAFVINTVATGPTNAEIPSPITQRRPA